MEPNELNVTTTALMGDRLRKLQQTAMGLVGVGAVLCLINLAFGTAGVRQIFEAYLAGYMVWFGVSAGSLGFLMLHHTVGGGWGFIIRRFMEGASRLLPLMLVLFIPVLLTLFLPVDALYRWHHVDASQHHHYGWAHPDRGFLIGLRGWWFVPWFFILRLFIYFGILYGFTVHINRLGATQYERSDRQITDRLNKVSAFGILIFVLTITFAAVDWTMSLTPHWFSSIWGLLATASMALSTFALMLWLVGSLGAETGVVRGVPHGYFRDLGNFTLAVVLLWAYMTFSQYLIHYAGNIAEDAPWHIVRQNHGWQFLSLTLIGVHFVLPFFILLTWSQGKRSPALLARIGLFILVARCIEQFWVVAPSFREHISITPADFGAPMLIGGIWLWAWARDLLTKETPVVALHDPRFVEHIAAHHAAGHEVAQHG